jgi:hypothetical protein
MVIGWNFGDGHLNGKQLLDAMQAQCGFESGELRVVSVESEPLLGSTMAWTVYDAATGELASGVTEMTKLRPLQPYPTGRHAEAFSGSRVDAPA